MQIRMISNKTNIPCCNTLCNCALRSRARKITWLLRQLLVLVLEGLQPRWIVETWRVTVEYDYSDVNQKSKRILIGVDTPFVSSSGNSRLESWFQIRKPWKRKKRKRGDIFPVLGTIIISFTSVISFYM